MPPKYTGPTATSSTPTDSVRPPTTFARNRSEYDDNLDWLRVLGRGIGCFRTSKYYNRELWMYDGELDEQDLRHNRQMGNWVEMTDIRYNRPNSDFKGENMRLYADEDYYNDKGELVVAAGQLLCKDTIRSWYPIPLYKIYVLDQSASGNMGADQFNGATKGANCSNGNMYLFRLAETYLLRAEARFYQGNASGAAQDVNKVSARANAKKMFTTVTIGDILDERSRAIPRRVAPARNDPHLMVSCTQRTARRMGRNLRPQHTWDKQSGTDLSGR